MAKGEGIMTTAERKEYREFKKWSDEANDIEQNCMRPEGCIVSALRLGLNMGRYSIEHESVLYSEGSTMRTECACKI